MPRQPTANDDDTVRVDPGLASWSSAPSGSTLPANVRLLRGRGPSGRVGPIGQTDVSETEAVQRILDAAQTPIDAYRQQLFRSSRVTQEGSSIVDWWHAGQTRRAIDAACIQFARLTPTAQQRVLASLPRSQPRLVRDSGRPAVERKSR
jgi:hypothetical protein